MSQLNKKNIALIGTSATAAIRFRGDFIKYLINDGHTVFVWCHDFTDETKNVIKSLGAVPVDSPLSRSNSNPLNDITAVFQMVKLIKAQKINCVLSYFIKPVVFGTLAARLAGIKNCYAMIEGLGWAFSQSPPGEKTGGHILKLIQITLMFIALPFAKTVIFLNEDDQNCLIRRYYIPIRNSKILGAIGAPTQFFHASPVPTNPIRFIFVARLLFDKGIREFMAAAEIVKQKYPGVSFDIYGAIDPENPRSLNEDDVEAFRKKGFVNFHGYQSDIGSIYQSGSCLILPSYREGFPRTVQEIMAMGRPAIVTDVPGCRQSVIDGQTGFIVPVFDVQTLADKIEILINNPDLLKTMGENAHLYAQKYYDGEILAKKLAAMIL
mgnify:CR=1 FL=1